MLEIFLISQVFVLAVINFGAINVGLTTDSEYRNWFFTRNLDDIGFYLYRNAIDDQPKEIIFLNKTSLNASGYNPKLPVVLLIHGLLANRKTAVDLLEIKNAYLSIKFAANIILMDYGELAGNDNPAYQSISNLNLRQFATKDSPIVGQRVAQFIEYLVKNGALEGPDKVHLIGFGLGCQIAGEAGTRVKLILKISIGRITGLDCPSDKRLGPSQLLDKTDANFVDVTHTSLGRAGNNILTPASGHVDFYMFGGGRQPGCSESDSLFPFPELEAYCSHSSSIHYFAKSILNKNIACCKCQICADFFPVCPKDNLDIYGQSISQSVRARGSYYVRL